MKRIMAFLLSAALLLGLCGCGGKEVSRFRVIETVGDKQYGVVCRLGDKAFDAVDAAMDVLAANGTLSSFSSGWLGNDRICLEGNINALNELNEEIAPRTLIVGVESDFRPLSFADGGEYMGMSVDIAKAIGELLGWEIKIQPVRDGDVATQLSSGNIDCALGFGIEGISSEKYSVGDCYMESSIVVAAYTDSEIKSMKDLKELRIGTINDPSVRSSLQSSEKVTKYAAGATVYLSPTRCLNALDKGWCAAIAIDDILLAEYSK